MARKPAPPKARIAGQREARHFDGLIPKLAETKPHQIEDATVPVGANLSRIEKLKRYGRSRKNLIAIRGPDGKDDLDQLSHARTGRPTDYGLIVRDCAISAALLLRRNLREKKVDAIDAVARDFAVSAKTVEAVITFMAQSLPELYSWIRTLRRDELGEIVREWLNIKGEESAS